MKILNEFYGFDKPVPVRYLLWLKNICMFNLGESTRYAGTPVIELITERLPVSIFFGIMTTLILYSVSIPLGIIKAIKHRTAIDNITSIIIFAGYSIPNFALGMLLLIFLSVKWEIFPIGGFVSMNFEDLSFWEKTGDLFHHAVLPLFCYTLGSFAAMTMLMKNSLLENMSADYVKTALAKGVTRRRAIFVHAFRNSLIPIATSFGNNIALFMTGSFLIEKVFNINGMGLFGFDSIVSRDFPSVMGLLVITSLLMLIGNLLSDMCVAAVDPRVRFK